MQNREPFPFKAMSAAGMTNEAMNNAIAGYLSEKDYTQTQSMLLLQKDAYESITSEIVIDPTRKIYPTGVAMVRDATNALPISDEKRLAPNSWPVRANSMLLRTLETVRGVDHALAYLAEQQPTPRLKQKYLDAMEHVAALMNKLFIDTRMLATNLTYSYEDLEDVQKLFNTNLIISVMEPYGLTAGLEKAKEFDKLLFYYGDLASSINPAVSLVTETKLVTTDKETGEAITAIKTETTYPITKKTPAQIEQFSVMQHAEIVEGEAENFHNVKSKAFQIAEMAHYDCIIQPDTTLSAQNRKYLPGLKNAAIVKNEVNFYDANNNRIIKQDAKGKDIDTTIWNARCASVVYVGDGEGLNKSTPPERLKAYARENIEQIMQASKEIAGKDKLHWIMLNTSALNIENQASIVSISKSEAKERTNNKGEREIRWSNLPLNTLGKASPYELSALVREVRDNPDSTAYGMPDPSKEATRLQMIADSFKVVEADGTHINLISCASGQDRTFVAKKAGVDRAVERLHEAYGTTATLEQIEISDARGVHDAIYAERARPGSGGIKNDSRQDDYFEPETSALYYRKDAETNKPHHEVSFDKENINTLIAQPLHALEIGLIDCQREVNGVLIKIMSDAEKSSDPTERANKTAKEAELKNVMAALKAFDPIVGNINTLAAEVKTIANRAKNNIPSVGAGNTIIKNWGLNSIFGNRASGESTTAKFISNLADKIEKLPDMQKAYTRSQTPPP